MKRNFLLGFFIICISILTFCKNLYAIEDATKDKDIFQRSAGEIISSDEKSSEFPEFQKVDISLNEIIIRFKNPAGFFSGSLQNKRKKLTEIPSLKPIIEDKGLISLEGIFGKLKIQKKSLLSDVFVLKLNKKYANKEEMLKAIKQISEDPQIISAFPQILYKLSLNAVNYDEDDPYLNLQWGLNKINATVGWQNSNLGEGIVVAVVDTGIDFNHEDLANNVWVNPGEDINQNGVVDPEDFNGVDDDNNGLIDDLRGWNFFEGNNDITDTFGHGTHCAGIIAAEANDVGVRGVAYQSKIMGLRVGDEMGIPTTAIVEACYYAVEKGANIISMSFGGPIEDPILLITMKSIAEEGVILVAAAGNGGSDDYAYPAAFDEIISVGASDELDEEAYFSQFGDWVNTVAPGVEILSLRAEGTDMYGDGTHIFPQPDGDYYYANGTSMACPFVSGAAALLLSNNPQLTKGEILNKIKSFSSDFEFNKYPSTYFEGGRLNLEAQMFEEIEPPFNVELRAIDYVLGEGVFEPDETEALRITLRNKGAQTAENVEAYLECDSPYVNLINNHISFGDIAEGQTKQNDEEYFKIRIAANTPQDEPVQFQLTININGGFHKEYIIDKILNHILPSQITNAELFGKMVLENSPYFVNTDVLVPRGEILKIEPGVEVKFNQGCGLEISGGIYAAGEADNPIRFDKETTFKWQGIAIYKTTHDCFFKNCIIKEAEKNNVGGGIFAQGRGGGIYALNNKTLLSIVDSTISNNVSVFIGAGLDIARCSHVYLLNTIIKNNTAGGWGAGLSHWNSQIKMSNCIVNANTWEGNSFYGLPTGILRLENSIIYAGIYSGQYSVPGYMAGGQIHPLGTAVQQNFSDIEGLDSVSTLGEYWSDGEGNIEEDPQFVDPIIGDFHLQPGSPCIDTGNPDLIYNDFDGTRNDMGIYGGNKIAFSKEDFDFGPMTLNIIFFDELELFNGREDPITINDYYLQEETGLSISISSPQHRPITVSPGRASNAMLEVQPLSLGEQNVCLNLEGDDFIGGVIQIKVEAEGIEGKGIVMGRLSGVMDASCNPYIIYGNLEVVKGESLTVEPGVQIKFIPYYQKTDNFLMYYAQITNTFNIPAASQLFINGSSASRVVIESYYPDQKWHGMLVGNGAIAEIHYAELVNLGTEDYFYFTPCFSGSSGSQLTITDSSMMLDPYSFIQIAFFDDIAIENTIISDTHVFGLLDNNNILLGNNNISNMHIFNTFMSDNIVIENNTISNIFSFDIPLSNNVAIEDNTFFELGHFYFEASQDATVENNTFSNTNEFVVLFSNNITMENNTALGSWINVSVIESSEVLMRRNIFSATAVSSNLLDSYNLQIINCDFVNGLGGAMFDWSSYSTNAIIKNCIFNGTSTFNANNSGNLIIDYSNFFPQAPQLSGGAQLGEGNIYLDPLFIAPANNNYYLQAGSSCIDTGDPNPIYNDPDGSRNDIGAYSFTSTPLFASITYPNQGQSIYVNQTVDILGYATGADFSSYLLEYGAGESPSEWIIINNSNTPVENGLLGTWNATGFGTYQLRLTVIGQLVPPEVAQVQVVVAGVVTSITSPTQGQNIYGSQTVDILGSATGTDFASYVLEYGSGANPSEWITISNSSTPVENGLLGVWNTSGLELDIYQLRLTVYGESGPSGVVQIQVNCFPEEYLIVPVEYSTIQEAINAAQPGNTIFVLSGTYEINSSIVVDKDLTIISQKGAEYTTIMLTDSCFTAFIMNTGLTRNTLLQGFTITKSSGWYNGILLEGNSNPIISNNKLFSIPGGMGIEANANSGALIRNNIISGFIDGIKAMYNAPLEIVNNTIVNNGANIHGNALMQVKNCIIYSHLQFSIWPGTNPVITYSDVQGGWPGEGNIDADPMFVGSGDYHLQEGSPCIDAGDPDPIYNDPDGTRNDMGAYGGPNGDW